jgi:putative ABC transport system permease protein
MMSRLALWLALRIVALIALLVPAAARREWRREWEAELQHSAAQRRLKPHLSWGTNMTLISRAFSSLTDAAWHLLKFNQTDLRITMRRLFRSRAFVVATVGTLTLGLGMFAVVYTVVDRVLLKPMPYKNPDDLYFVWRDYGAVSGPKRTALPGKDVLELQKAGGVIEGAVALQPFLGGVFSLREGTDPMEISVMVTSPGLFEMLGVAPARGRVFSREDAGPNRPFTIVLTHEFWSRLGADPGILGTEVRMNGRPHTVIGVLPPDFKFVRNAAEGPAQRPDAYSNLRVNLTDPSPNQTDYSGLIRARHGTSPDAVAAAVDAIGRAIVERDSGGRGFMLRPVGLQADLVAGVRPALLVLGAAGVVLALMLLVNLASILLSRAARREQEFGVSRALGANSGALMRATLLEGGILGFLGGALGTLVAIWGTQVLVALAPLDLPRREEMAVSWEIGAVVIALGTLLGLLAAVTPAVWAAHASLSWLLANSAVRGGGGHGFMRRSMIVAQVAFSLVLLSSGALVVRSLEQLLRADPGFTPEGVFTVLVRTPPVFFPNIPDVRIFQERVHSALARLPGVTAASATNQLPLTVSPTRSSTRLTIPGAPGNNGDPEHDALLTDIIVARKGYPEVMGMRLLAGRSPERFGEALIDARFAKHFFPEGNAVGTQIPFDNLQATIVGVVQQARLYDVHQDGRPQIYFRAEDNTYRPMFYVMRTERPPQALLPEIRTVVRQIDSRVAVGEARTMDEIVGNSLRQQQTSAALISAFAVGALILAAMGLFGVISGSVTRRSHELAVRMALGADQRAVLRLVLREGALLVAFGVLIGLPGILAAGGLIRAILVGVSPSDPLTLAAVSLGLVLVTLATCYVPARRVLKIEPAQLLVRSDR